MKIVQDGNTFYNEYGDLVYEASFSVKDDDLDAAQAARNEFIAACSQLELERLELKSC